MFYKTDITCDIDEALETAKKSIVGSGQATKQGDAQWEWVDSQSDTLNTRRFIRAHVARHSKPRFRRKKQQLKQSGPGSSKDNYSYRGSVIPRLGDVAFQPLSPGPVSILGAGRIDPFRSFPLSVDSMRLQEYVDYC